MELRMDVRSIVDVEPEVEHNGTVPVWYLVHPREMRALTEGGSLELVNEFEVAAGGAVFPHEHPTHEFYFVMTGRGVMTGGDEGRPVRRGALVYIPPDTVHSLRPTGGGAIHCFCIAVAVKGAPEINYSTHDEQPPSGGARGDQSLSLQGVPRSDCVTSMMPGV